MTLFVKLGAHYVNPDAVTHIGGGVAPDCCTVFTVSGGRFDVSVSSGEAVRLLREAQEGR